MASNESPCPHLTGLLPQIRPPTLSQNVHREECTQCFDSQDMEPGIDVCLHCFNGGCASNDDRNHAISHAQKWDHPLALNVKRKLKERAKRDSSEPPLKKLAVRASTPESEKYDFIYTPKCYLCSPLVAKPIPTSQIEDPSSEPLRKTIEGVKTSASSGMREEVKAWEEELTSCTHVEGLEAETKRKIEPSGLASCASCDLTSNLWLCLVCGNLGCGRQQYGGIGGNSHGLAHYEQSGHAASVKLGTITAEGTADIYCYKCNDERLDPYLAKHLANFGIEVSQQTKTEKSLTELQIEQNLKFDFSMTGEDGKEFEPLYGPGLTGMRNLGNSCYMASVLQSLYSLPSFSTRYFLNYATHSQTCMQRDPSQCFECQMGKVADGLLSGRYSLPRPIEKDEELIPGQSEGQAGKRWQEGIRPMAFKGLIGKDHPEFSTMRQQDADEFLRHLFKVIKRENKRAATSACAAGLPETSIRDPTDVCDFGMEQRLQCRECKGVRYRTDEMEALSIPVPAREKISDELMAEAGKGKDPLGTEAAATTTASQADKAKVQYEPVSLAECFQMLTGIQDLEYKCPRCNKNVVAEQTSRFATFPEVLIVHARKFQLVNWVPQKLDIPLVIPYKALSMDEYLSTGKQPNEEELPQGEEASSATEPQFNEEALAQLEAMGFPTVRCQKALLATGNSDPNAAMEWLFGHMEDPDIDTPIASTAASGQTTGPSEEQIMMLSEMGFTPAQARKALRETGSDAERAVEWLFSHPDDMGEDAAPAAGTAGQQDGPKRPPGSSALPANYRLKAFISHKGPSVHSGHYVAHIWREGEGWVFYNDEKVVKVDEQGAQSAEALMPYAYVYIFEKTS